MFPVLGPPDTLGPGSRETQVFPSEHGAVALPCLSLTFQCLFAAFR